MSVRLATLGLGLALLSGTPACLAAERFLLVVSGLGGEAEYAERFHQWAAKMVDAATGRLGLPAENVVWLSADPERAPDRVAGRSDAAAVEDAIDRLAARSAPGDTIMILLIGHGTSRPGRALFNVPGPDLSASALAGALDALAGRTVAVVNTTSASGAFLAPLSAPGRVVATATASGAENQHTRFAAHFVDAYAGDAADADKDGRVSVLEAFDYARREVERDYRKERRLLAEHAMLDDDGDGVGARGPDADAVEEAAEGTLARTVHLAAGSVEAAGGDPRRALLEEHARDIVARIEAYRRRKAGLTAEDYQQGLEALLVELALNRRAIAEEPAS